MKQMKLYVAIGVILLAAASFGWGVAHADTKISALPAASTLAGTEAIPAVQSATTVKTTPAAITTYTNANSGKITASTGAATTLVPSYKFTSTNNTGTNEPNVLVTGNVSGAGIGLWDSNSPANQRLIVARYHSGLFAISACSDNYGSCYDFLQAYPDATAHISDLIIQSPDVISKADTWFFKDKNNGNNATVFINGTPVYPSFPADSPSTGGSALLAGECTSNVVTVTGAQNTMAVVASPVNYPGDGAIWSAQITGVNEVTVRVCAIVAMTPTASIYRVRVIQ